MCHISVEFFFVAQTSQTMPKHLGRNLGGEPGMFFLGDDQTIPVDGFTGPISYTWKPHAVATYDVMYRDHDILSISWPFMTYYRSIVWPELIYRWSPLCRSVAILLQSPSMPQEGPTVASSQTPPYFTLEGRELQNVEPKPKVSLWETSHGSWRSHYIYIYDMRRIYISIYMCMCVYIYMICLYTYLYIHICLHLNKVDLPCRSEWKIEMNTLQVVFPVLDSASWGIAHAFFVCAETSRTAHTNWSLP